MWTLWASLGTNLTNFLCHCFVFLQNSIRISIPWLFRTCFHFFFNFNFRKHYNIGSNTILIELLKFRSKSRITVTLLTVIYCENWEYEFFEYYALLLFFLEAILQGVAKNKPIEKQVDAENQMTLKHAPAYLSFQIAKIDFNYNLQLLASEHQKQTPGGILWKRCS